ncbi:MAG: PulJ/GspJ family protein [Eubacteriales bacterium]
MNYHTNKAFTLVEVVISLCIFCMLSIALGETLNLSMKLHQKGRIEYDTYIQGERILKEIARDIAFLKREDITPEYLQQLCIDYMDKDERYTVTIEEGKYNDLYCVEIHYIGSEYEKLCTLVKSQ